VVFVACFHERFIYTTTAGYNSDGCPASCVKPFGFSTRHPDTDPVFDLVNNNCLYSGRTDKLASIVRA
jgi:hypothetical protein